jgi:hypothetical protein
MVHCVADRLESVVCNTHISWTYLNHLFVKEDVMSAYVTSFFVLIHSGNCLTFRALVNYRLCKKIIKLSNY